MSLNSLSEPMLFKRIVYWNWFGPGPSSLGSSFVMHPCPSHGQMGRPRPTIIKVCMSLAIHQTKRDRRKMERDAQSSKDSGDNSAVCRWVCSSTASIFCISVQMSCIVCCSATNQTIWTIIYIYIWKSATFMNCEFKSHLYRCHLPKSFFFLLLLFYRKDTDVPGWPARVLRDVGLLRFTLSPTLLPVYSLRQLH